MRPFKLLTLAILAVTLESQMLLASDARFPIPASSGLPMYPERARAAHVAGRVTLWFVLNEKGAVVQAGVVSGNPLLSGAALDTVRSWKFLEGNLPANVRQQTEFIYVLGEQEKKGAPRLTVSITDFRRIQVESELYVEAIE